MNWKHIDTGVRSAAANMALDAALLEDLKEEHYPILHLYDWETDSATFGHFISPEKFLNMEEVAKRGLDLAKRPTGGGIIFHQTDLAFSVLVPATHPAFSQNPLENYAFVNRRVIKAVQQMVTQPAQLLSEEPIPLDAASKHFCMAKPTKYDVMIGGKKIGGAAQRKTRDGFLHQGSISIALLPESYLRAILLPETEVFQGMQANSFSILQEQWTQKMLREVRRELRANLIENFKDD